MHREHNTATCTQAYPTGGEIFVAVEMSRSKWVVGVQNPLADKIALHTMACGDVLGALSL